MNEIVGGSPVKRRQRTDLAGSRGGLDGSSAALTDALRFLAEAGRILAGSLDYRTTLESIARLVVQQMADWCAISVTATEAAPGYLALHHDDPERLKQAMALRDLLACGSEDSQGPASAWRAGEPWLCEAVTEDMLEAVSTDPEELRALRAMEIRSAMMLPLKARGRTLGAIYCGLADSGRPYDSSDLALAGELSHRVALAIDTARLYEDAQRELADRKRAEDSLRESAGRLRAVVENAVDGIITIDAAGMIRTINPAVERIFGYRAEELIGRNVNMLMPEPYHREHDAYLANYLRTREAKIIGIGREVSGRRKDGSVFPLYLGVSEMSTGSRIEFTGIVRDISAAKAIENSLARQARELARSNAELEQFASIVSHDLRAPLVTIGGCVQLLARQVGDALTPENAELITMIRQSVAGMGSLIKSLLSYSRLGAGGLRVNPCDGREVLDRVQQSLAGELEQAGAALTADALPVIRADEALLAQLLQNLIENAVKYRGSEPPRVHVSAEPRDGEWIFAVRDNGIGIDPAFSANIFEPFRRLHADESRYSGSGMGLATCKKIVERHGGRIWVESQPGQGCTFRFTIPF